MSTNKLSVVIITFNEEKNISRCLQSVKMIADEILVVDSYSTDRTEEICESYNVRFIKNKFEGHVEQKNFTLENASFDLILSLDADEALSPELMQNIIEIKANLKNDVYELVRLTNYCGKWIRHGSWYPDRKIRLIKKGAGKWTGENPHDKFEPNPNASVGKMKGDLLHYSYYTIAGHIDQVNKFTSIGAKSAYDAGRRADILMLFYKPFYKFVRDYIFKMGFLDGMAGFTIARISAHATFLKYSKLLELQKNKRSGG